MNDMTEHGRGTLHAFIRERRREKLSRWSSYRRKWGRRLLNSGEGVYFLLIIIIAFAALAARGAITTFRAHHDAFRGEIRSILQGAHEPRRDPYFGVVATLLAPLAQPPAQDPYSEDFQALSREARQLWRAHDALWRAVTGQTTIRKAVSTAASALAPSHVVSPEGISEWNALTTVDLERISSAWRSADPCQCELRACEPPQNSTSHDGDYGPMGCREAGANERVILMAPSFANLPMPSTCTGATTSDFRCSKRVYRASLHRGILERVLALQALVGGEHRATGALQIAQVYVISPEDVIALSSASATPSSLDYPVTRRWASTHYFEAFYESNGREYDQLGHSTQPYIDYGGNGIVRSVCHPLLLQDDDRAPPKLQALFCVDFSYSLTAIKDVLKRSNILEPEYVQIDLKQDRSEPITVTSPVSTPTELTGRDLIAIENQLNWSRKERREVTRSITPLQLDREGNSFLVPLGRTAPEPSIVEAVLLSVSLSLPTSVWVYSLVSLGFGGFGLLALALGASHARNTADRRELGRWLKTLQVGVLIVGPDDVVEAGNDRAEEIMARSLPRIALAEEESHLCIRFDQCIDDAVIEWDEGHFEVKSYSRDIRSRRQAGETSRYFAKLTSTGEWVQITASPILSSSTAVPTYGVVESVLDSRRWHLLEVAHQLAKAGSTGVIICDRHGQIKASNSAARALIGESIPALDLDGAGGTRQTIPQCFTVLLTEEHLACSEVSVPAEGCGTRTFFGLVNVNPARWVRLRVARLAQSAWDPHSVCRAYVQLAPIEDPRGSHPHTPNHLNPINEDGE